MRNTGVACRVAEHFDLALRPSEARQGRGPQARHRPDTGEVAPDSVAANMAMNVQDKGRINPSPTPSEQVDKRVIYPLNPPSMQHWTLRLGSVLSEQFGSKNLLRTQLMASDSLLTWEYRPYIISLSHPHIERVMQVDIYTSTGQSLANPHRTMIYPARMIVRRAAG